MAGLLIGYRETSEEADIGFRGDASPAPGTAEAVVYDDEGHLMTIAPTGAGKGVSCVVPAILRHRGPVIVLDLKGENYAMTRAHRARSGSRVSCIDPFGLARRVATGAEDVPQDEIAGFNPFDLLPYLSDDRETACRALADKLIPPGGHRADPFWRHAEVSILAALIECYESLGGSLRSISAIVSDLGTEIDYRKGVGGIGLGDDAQSRLAANPVALDIIEGAGATVGEVWSAYKASGAPSRGGSADPLSDFLESPTERAIRLTLELNPDRDTSKDAEIIERICSESAGELRCRARFESDLEMSHDLSPADAALLWDILEEAFEAQMSFAYPGTVAQTRRGQEAPEHFPLALHRLARHPGSMARSAALQAFNSDRTWASIMLSLRADMAVYSGRSIANTLSGNNGIDLDALRRGDNQSIYIAFPPDRAKSHSSLFRIMVDGLLSVLCSRVARPADRTLLLLDEVAQLGRLDLLVTAKTLLRGYGVQAWSFWQDISQLQVNYPEDWPTIVNNCRVIEVFGRGMGTMAVQLGQALDVSPDRIDALRPEEALVWIDGKAPAVVRRPVCHQDPDMRWLCRIGPFARPARPGDAPVGHGPGDGALRDLFAEPPRPEASPPAIRDLFADQEAPEEDAFDVFELILKDEPRR